MPIPTEVIFSNCTFIRGDQSTALLVKALIDVVKVTLEGHGWTYKGKFKAHTTLTFGGVVAQAGAFDTIILDYMGYGFRVFNSGLGDRDPTGDAVAGHAATFVGVDMVGLEGNDPVSDYARVLRVIEAMNGKGSPPWIVEVSDQGPSLLTIRETPDDNVQRNDFFWFANVLSGYQFNGPTKYGGWEHQSSDSNPEGISAVKVGYYSTPTNNFVMDITFVGGPGAPPVSLPPFYTWNRPDAWMVINPYMWIVGNLNLEYNNQNVDEVNHGAADMWLCCPRITPQIQITDPFNPINYAAFMTISGRNVLCDKASVVYVNGILRQGPGFLEDTGMCLIPLNSMYHAAGKLTTTTGLPIQISSIMALSEGNEEVRIIGDVYDMYLVSKYYPINTYFYRPTDHRLVFAYRSQQEPCEVTLLCAVDTFNPWLDTRPHAPGVA